MFKFFEKLFKKSSRTYTEEELKAKEVYNKVLKDFDSVHPKGWVRGCGVISHPNLKYKLRVTVSSFRSGSFYILQVKGLEDLPFVEEQNKAFYRFKEIEGNRIIKKANNFLTSGYIKL